MDKILLLIFGLVSLNACKPAEENNGPKVYKKCSDITDLAICKSIKNTQKSPKLTCKPSVDGKTCVDDVINLKTPEQLIENLLNSTTVTADSKKDLENYLDIANTNLTNIAQLAPKAHALAEALHNGAFYLPSLANKTSNLERNETIKLFVENIMKGPDPDKNKAVLNQKTGSYTVLDILLSPKNYNDANDKTLVEYLKTKGAKTDAELIGETQKKIEEEKLRIAKEKEINELKDKEEELKVEREKLEDERIKAEAEKKKLEDEKAEQEKIEAVDEEIKKLKIEKEKLEAEQEKIKKEEEKRIEEEKAEQERLKAEEEKKLKEEEEKKKGEPAIVINPPIIIPLIQPGNDDIRTIALWEPLEKFDDSELLLLKEKLKEQVPKGSEDKINFEIINKKDIDEEIKNWSKEKFEKTVIVFAYLATSIDRLEGFDIHLAKNVISLKTGEENIFPAGRALLPVLKVESFKNMKDGFSRNDLSALGYFLSQDIGQAFNGSSGKIELIGAYRILVNKIEEKGIKRTDPYITKPFSEIYDCDQNKKNLKNFQEEVIIPLLDFKKKEEI